MKNLLITSGLIVILLTAASTPIFAQTASNSPSDHKILLEAIWAPAAGFGDWSTEIQLLAYESGTQVYVQFAYDTGEYTAFLLWISPGSMRLFKTSNILELMDQLDPDGSHTYQGKVGTIEFIASGNIHVTARTCHSSGYSKIVDAINYDDQTYQIMPSNQKMILNLIENSDYRTVCGFYALIGPSHIQFTLKDQNNNTIGNVFAKDFVPGRFYKFNPFTEAGANGSYSNAYLIIRNVYGYGPICAFGATAKNSTNDPATHTLLAYQ